MTSEPAHLPDVLVAVDVDSVELVLQVFVLHVCHVVDHLQNHEARQDRQHQPLLGGMGEAGNRTCIRWIHGCIVRTGYRTANMAQMGPKNIFPKDGNTKTKNKRPLKWLTGQL